MVIALAAIYNIDESGMKKSKFQSSPLIGFLIGVTLCLVGILILFFVFKQRLLEKNTQQNSPINNTQSQTNNGVNNDPILNNASSPQTTAIDQSNIPLDRSSNNFQDSTMIDSTVSSGNLGLVHGKGEGNHLTSLPTQYSDKNELVNINTKPSLIAMIAEAKNDGIKLNVVSAFRSYDHQKRIWENKWGNAPLNDINQALYILRYSSYPGTSRHHWGTDVDLNSVSLGYWETNEGRRVHQWLLNNGPRYGFCQVYSPGRNKGYSDEPWHWSHMPTANYYFSQITQPNVFRIALTQNIKGGEAVRQMPERVMEYIKSISSCSYSTNSIPRNTTNENGASVRQKDSQQGDMSFFSDSINNNNNIIKEVYVDDTRDNSNNSQLEKSSLKPARSPKPPLPKDPDFKKPIDNDGRLPRENQTNNRIMIVNVADLNKDAGSN